MTAVLWSAAPGFELRDVRIKAVKGKAYAEIQFSKSQGEKGFPLFFHQSDARTGLLTISFLETESAFALGDYAIENGGKTLTNLGLKRFRSPSGKNFLGLEFHLAEPPKQVVLDEKGSTSVRVGLQAKVDAKFNWSLAAAAKSQASAPQVASQSIGAGLLEIRLTATPAQETVILDFGTAVPKFTAGKSELGSDWLLVTFSAQESMGRKELVFPHDGVFRTIRMKSSDGILTVELRAVGGAKLHVLPQGGEFHIVSASGKVKQPVQWSSQASSGQIRQADILPDPVEGAHKAGKSLEAGSNGRTGKSISSSDVFSPSGESKPMNIRKDSVSRSGSQVQAEKASERRVPADPEPELVASPKEIPLPAAMPEPVPIPSEAMSKRLAQEKKAAEEEKIKVKLAEEVTYNSYGRRDPFVPVESGHSDNGIIIDQMKVVGIIWQGAAPIAVLEHTKESGVSYTVRQGDPVHNGRVTRITRDAVTFNITEYGISRSYSLKLVSQEGVSR